MWVPPDAEAVTREWEGRKSGHRTLGACGPCALAAVLERSVAEVLGVWEAATGKPYQGYAPRRQERAVLAHLGFGALARPGKPQGYTWPRLEEGEVALASVKWHPHEEWHHWFDQESHVIGLARLGGQLLAYCNGLNEWVRVDVLDAQDYLKGAHISSYLLVRS